MYPTCVRGWVGRQESPERLASRLNEGMTMTNECQGIRWRNTALRHAVTSTPLVANGTARQESIACSRSSRATGDPPCFSSR